MNLPTFEWDAANLAHIAEHGVRPEEAEQVILNRPLDQGRQLRNGEERFAHIGETNHGRVLVVITTTAAGKIRVVTSWPANKNYRQYFAHMKRNGNAGRTHT